MKRKKRQGEKITLKKKKKTIKNLLGFVGRTTCKPKTAGSHKSEAGIEIVRSHGPIKQEQMDRNLLYCRSETVQICAENSPKPSLPVKACLFHSPFSVPLATRWQRPAEHRWRSIESLWCMQTKGTKENTQKRLVMYEANN